jgi:hypothetical protein
MESGLSLSKWFIIQSPRAVSTPEPYLMVPSEYVLIININHKSWKGKLKSWTGHKGREME